MSSCRDPELSIKSMQASISMSLEEKVNPVSFAVIRIKAEIRSRLYSEALTLGKNRCLEKMGMAS
ncbi:hypothetical protein VI817_008399 [Penicillium citrinum]|nr:hypothetical protein VI817_008399 [Penicillium citrinum]